MDRYPKVAVAYEIADGVLLEIRKGRITGRFEKGQIQQNGIHKIRGNIKAVIGDGVLAFLDAEDKKLEKTRRELSRANRIAKEKEEKAKKEKAKREKAKKAKVKE